MEIHIGNYEKGKKELWDDFVMNHSVNGTFLQTRRFLEYHKQRFEDQSLMVWKGMTLIAIIPGCVIHEKEKRIFSSHKGSTFGGIVIGWDFYDVEHLSSIMNGVDEYFQQEKFDEVRMKITSDLFSRKSSDLLSYFLYKDGFSSMEEISCYIDFEKYSDDIVSNFKAGKRRDYRYSLKYDLTFKELCSDDEIKRFYDILCENLRKFNTNPVHSLDELFEFKKERLQDIVRFYGVFKQNIMIAGSMVFTFHKQVFHTQYLAASREYLKMYPMNFLDTHLIMEAQKEGFRYFSFGTSTEDHGKVLNKPLIQFKEAFGTNYSVNRSYVKDYHQKS